MSKNGKDIGNRAASIAGTLAERYFYEMSHRMYGDILRKPSICNNYTFAGHFDAVTEDADIVEHYYVDNPSGFLVINHEGIIDRYIAQGLPEYKESMFNLVRNPLIAFELEKVLTGDSYTADLYDLNGALSIAKIRAWRDNVYPLSIFQSASQLTRVTLHYQLS